MKFALISETLPPSQTGQAMVLHRLLEGFDPDEYCLMSRYNWAEYPGPTAAPRLPAPYYEVPPRRELTRGYRYGLSHPRQHINLVTGIFTRAKQIEEIVKSEKCDVVVACTGDPTDLPAGYLASRRAGVPFYAYIFDHFSYREWMIPARRFWAKRLEPMLMRGATGVIATNETLRDELRKQYGVEAAVIHNSFDSSAYESLADIPPAPPNGEVKIVYTGDIYDAHYDAFRNLITAINKLGGIRLHLYTPRTLDELADLDIRGAVTRHDYLPPSEVPGIQREADLLFLPLAFDSPYPDLVRTSATTKLGEYLATSRPVLVHAPPDSFVARYVKEHRCGVLVDRSDPAALAEAIEAVLADAELRSDLSGRARERARADFSISVARRKFREFIEGGGARRGGTRAV
jgi:glycosyltransferase involved in cell wall biosynthesis